MSATGSGKAHHVKYRVLEAAMAGCLLFEEENPITPLYFEPGIDYVEYDSIDGLVNQVKNNTWPDRAHKLRLKAIHKYSAKRFWTKVFAALGHSLDLV